MTAHLAEADSESLALHEQLKMVKEHRRKYARTEQVSNVSTAITPAISRSNQGERLNKSSLQKVDNTVTNEHVGEPLPSFDSDDEAHIPESPPKGSQALKRSSQRNNNTSHDQLSYHARAAKVVESAIRTTSVALESSCISNENSNVVNSIQTGEFTEMRKYTKKSNELQLRSKFQRDEDLRSECASNFSQTLFADRSRNSPCMASKCPRIGVFSIPTQQYPQEIVHQNNLAIKSTSQGMSGATLDEKRRDRDKSKRTASSFFGPEISKINRPGKVQQRTYISISIIETLEILRFILFQPRRSI